MPGGTNADLAALDAIARKLGQAGDQLDSAGRSAPKAPDAGEVTALIGGVLAHLSDGAGNLVVGLKEAGDRVRQSREAYQSQDAAAGRHLRRLF